MQKSEENFKTLQLAVECHSMNKNQSLIKMKPVVPEKNAKKWSNFGNFASGCRMPQHKKKQRFIKIKPVVPEKNAKNWETL